MGRKSDDLGRRTGGFGNREVERGRERFQATGLDRARNP
jgi:hypothetical protein